MASIAGLDVPFGSSVQLVRVNVLVADAAASPTAAAAANLPVDAVWSPRLLTGPNESGTCGTRITRAIRLPPRVAVE